MSIDFPRKYFRYIFMFSLFHFFPKTFLNSHCSCQINLTIYFLDNSSTKKLSGSQKSSRHSSGIFMESNRNSDRNQSDGEDGDVVLDVFSVPEQDRAK